MDRLWTPWRYNYITAARAASRRGVPEELDGWPGKDMECVFCNLIASVRWGAQTLGLEAAERAGLVVAQGETGYICLNRYPYASGHVLLVPYRHVDSLAALPVAEAEAIMRDAQRTERVLREIYKPHGINLGMNLGEAAGAGVAGHIHLHILPRWVGDTNFMTVVSETRILPEELEETWRRLRTAYVAQAT